MLSFKMVKKHLAFHTSNDFGPQTAVSSYLNRYRQVEPETAHPPDSMFCREPVERIQKEMTTRLAESSQRIDRLQKSHQKEVDNLKLGLRTKEQQINLRDNIINTKNTIIESQKESMKSMETQYKAMIQDLKDDYALDNEFDLTVMNNSLRIKQLEELNAVITAEKINLESDLIRVNGKVLERIAEITAKESEISKLVEKHANEMLDERIRSEKQLEKQFEDFAKELMIKKQEEIANNERMQKLELEKNQLVQDFTAKIAQQENVIARTEAEAQAKVAKVQALKTKAIEDGMSCQRSIMRNK